MGDENPIRTLGDYSRPSHEGYRNTIELPVGNKCSSKQITTSCGLPVVSFLTDTQYTLERFPQGFVEYASARTMKRETRNAQTMSKVRSNASQSFEETKSGILDEKAKENKEEEKDSPENIHVNPSTPPDPSVCIDPEKLLGKPFVEISNMTHDSPEGVVRFTNGTDEVAYKMPHMIEQYNSLSDLEKEHTKSVYLRNEEDKRRGVEYVMSKIFRFYKECLELGPEYVTGMDDEREVT
ncbi:hypothetical protein Tco_0784608 [Tanacetum coccineum]